MPITPKATGTLGPASPNSPPSTPRFMSVRAQSSYSSRLGPDVRERTAHSCGSVVRVALGLHQDEAGGRER
jgi:hypothetical protein